MRRKLFWVIPASILVAVFILILPYQSNRAQTASFLSRVNQPNIPAVSPSRTSTPYHGIPGYPVPADLRPRSGPGYPVNQPTLPMPPYIQTRPASVSYPPPLAYYPIPSTPLPAAPTPFPTRQHGPGNLSYTTLSYAAQETSVLWVMKNQSFADRTQIGINPYYGYSWSPDGTKVAYARHSPGFGNAISIYDLTTQTEKFLLASGDIRSPSWSPDEKWIAFSGWVNGVSGILLVDPGGTTIWSIYTGPFDAGCLTWSPDSRRLAFSSNRTGNDEILVIDADGTNLLNLTHHPGSDRMPAWSPDGTQIAFISNRESSPRTNYEIFVMNVDGTTPKNITHNLSQNLSPAWSLDGSQIAYTSNAFLPGLQSQGTPLPRPAGNDIFIMNADGSQPERVTDGNNQYSSPSWKP